MPWRFLVILSLYRGSGNRRWLGREGRLNFRFNWQWRFYNWRENRFLHLRWRHELEHVVAQNIHVSALLRPALLPENRLTWQFSNERLRAF